MGVDMWKEYESRPVIRKAHEITEYDIIQPVDKTTCELFFDDDECLKTAGSVIFKHYETVKVGDFVVYLDDKDIYHCRREVFLERNIVE